MFLPWQDTYSMLSLRCFPPRCLLSLPFTEVSYPESSVQVSELTSTSSWYRLTSLISSSVVSIFLRSGLEILSFCWSHGLWFLCYDLQLIYLLIFYMYLSTSYWLRDSSRPVCMWLKFFFSFVHYKSVQFYFILWVQLLSLYHCSCLIQSSKTSAFINLELSILTQANCGKDRTIYFCFLVFKLHSFMSMICFPELVNRKQHGLIDCFLRPPLLPPAVCHVFFGDLRSLTRDWTRVLAVKAQNPNHQATWGTLN